MKIAVIGTGGVGGYFGGLLAKADLDVTFLARGAHAEAMREKGLTIVSTAGTFTVSPVKVTDTIRAMGKADLVILAVKAWQVKALTGQIKGLLGAGSVILPLQNGVVTLDELSEEIDRKHILGGLCRIFTWIESPGVIHQEGVDPLILFGETDNRRSEREIQLGRLFEKAGIKCRIAEDIQAELWKKFINICVSGLLAITRSTYGEIREQPESRSLMIEVLNEVYDVSQKMGIHIEPEFVGKTLAFIDTFHYDSTSSLTRDVWEGKPSEIEYQNGTVVRLGEKLGVPVPVNKFIYNCILPMERRARRKLKGE